MQGARPHSVEAGIPHRDYRIAVTGLRTRLRTIVFWAGRILSVVAVVCVIFLFVRTQAWRTLDFSDPRTSGALAIAVAIYSVATLCLAYGWVRWLRTAGAQDVPAGAGIIVFCRSQISKYIPGNIFHLVARQALGRELGASHPSLALSSVLESCALILVACLIAVLTNWSSGRLPAVPRLAVFIAGGLCLAGAIAAAIVIRRSDLRFAFRRSGNVALTLLCYLPFFLGNGLCLALLAGLNHSLTGEVILGMTGAWSASWLAGYVAPGPPGGLGVREATLIFALSGWMGQPESIALSMAMRLASIAGDVTLWLVSLTPAFGVMAGETNLK